MLTAILKRIERSVLRLRMYALDIHISDMTNVLQSHLNDQLRHVIERNRTAARVERKALGDRYYALLRAAKAKRSAETA